MWVVYIIFIPSSPPNSYYMPLLTGNFIRACSEFWLSTIPSSPIPPIVPALLSTCVMVILFVCGRNVKFLVSRRMLWRMSEISVGKLQARVSSHGLYSEQCWSLKSWEIWSVWCSPCVNLPNMWQSYQKTLEDIDPESRSACLLGGDLSTLFVWVFIVCLYCPTF